jgi:hypothetical protein
MTAPLKPLNESLATLTAAQRSFTTVGGRRCFSKIWREFGIRCSPDKVTLPENDNMSIEFDENLIQMWIVNGIEIEYAASNGPSGTTAFRRPL